MTFHFSVLPHRISWLKNFHREFDKIIQNRRVEKFYCIFKKEFSHFNLFKLILNQVDCPGLRYHSPVEGCVNFNVECCAMLSKHNNCSSDWDFFQCRHRVSWRGLRKKNNNLKTLEKKIEMAFRILSLISLSVVILIFAIDGGKNIENLVI